jgi:hypothetical protein
VFYIISRKKDFTNLFLNNEAGIAIGITGDAGVRATAQQPRMFVGMVSICLLVLK